MFTHLHVHSEYSLLDGACRIRDIPAKAKAMGQQSIAITDHGVMFGAVSFYKECVKEGVKPIIGCELYVARRTRFDKEHGIDNERDHLILLCKNDTGYRNLCYLVSMAFIEGYYIKPRIDMDLLKTHAEGLVALSACIQGRVPKLIIQGQYDEAKQRALEMREIFGDDYYLELQNHGLPEEKLAATGLIKLSKDTGIPLVLTNDVHYLARSDAYAQDVLMCIQMGKTVDDDDRMRMKGEELYLKNETEMRTLFPDLPEAADNTNLIAEKCNLTFEFGHYHLPEFQLPEGEDSAEDYLEKLCVAGLRERYPERHDELMGQLGYELNMINQMGFTDYFLIVQDFVLFAKRSGIPVGPGRGSAAGSLVSYCLHITDVDPIKYNLYFERFLNPERVSMPDIDMDFCERRRGEVVDYVKRKYGADRVAQIITFSTLKAKNAVRSVSKTMGLTFQEENELAKTIPNGPKITIKDALSMSSQLRDMIERDERIRKVIEVAQAIEDMPKDSGTHAAGVVITKNPVYTYVPLALSKKDNTIATQYTMTQIEELGLLKMDFLGLRNLTIIDDAVKDIQKQDPDFDITKIPDDDKGVYAMLSEGKTSGVFQLESSGMTGVCVGLKPKSIEDITAVIALYRPGPMDSIPRFLAAAQNPSKVTYKHPLLEPILNVTYGCIVYQEQVIEIFRKLGGFSLGQADMIRRAMSKKKQAEIVKERDTFINGDPTRSICGAVANGVPEDIAGSIYDEILDFANYAFNKAHAVSYAIVAYETAYLKYHYPREYMAALMSTVLDYPEKVAEYTAECSQMGIDLLPPDINKSKNRFSVEDGKIRYGLVAVKNIGSKFIESVMEEREENGEFETFYDFCDRMVGQDLNRRNVESLIKCGAFDSTGAKRSQLMEVVTYTLESVSNAHKKNIDGQMDLFFGGVKKENSIELPDIPEYSLHERLIMEKEVTGLYLSGHPMDSYRKAEKLKGTVPLGSILSDCAEESETHRYTDNQELTVAGVVVTCKVKPTKNGSLMAYVTLDDATGSMEMLVFQKTLDASRTYLQEGEVIFVSGRLSLRDEKAPQIVVNSVQPVSGGRQGKTEVDPSELKLYVKLPSESDPLFRRVHIVKEMFPGNQQMVIYFADTKKRVGTRCLIHDAFLQELRELLGDENVVVK